MILTKNSKKNSDFKENQLGDDEFNRKIQLFNNFRSRELVLKFANLVFENIMTKKSW